MVNRGSCKAMHLTAVSPVFYGAIYKIVRAALFKLLRVKMPENFLRHLFKKGTWQRSLLKIMKLITLLLFVTCMGAAAAGNSQQVNFKVKKTPLTQVLNLVKQQTGFVFFYSDKDMSQAQPVTIQLSNTPVTEALQEIFKNQPLNYSIKGNSVVITAKKQELKPPPPAVNIGAEEITENLPPPPINVKGRVVDQEGKPLPGTSIQVKGAAAKGVSSNADGYFELTNVEEGAILVISGVNIDSREIKVNGKTDLGDVVVRLKVQEGEEVVLVNTGYFTVPKERATGSFVHLNNETINRIPTTDVLGRIQGLASGVQLNKGSSDYGDQHTNIQIRGLSTIQSNADPLVVVDNFPFDGDLKSINPNDIESITILRDAASSSIWGARSGNGVIVIVTKKGGYQQSPKVSFSSNISLSGKPDMFYIPSINPADYIDWEVDLYNKGFYQGQINNVYMPPLTPALEVLVKRSAGLISSADSASMINNLKKYDLRNDMAKYFYRNALNQQHAINVSGGGAQHQYFVSFGYDKNIGNKINNDYSRYTLTANNTFSFLKKRLEIATNIWYASSKNKGSSNNNTVVATYPYARLADEQGNALRIDRYRQGFIDTVGAGMLLDWTYYPLNDLKYIDAERSIITNRLGVDVKYKITGPLDISVKYLYEGAQNKWYNYAPVESYAARDLINNFSILNYSTATVNRTIPLGGIMDQSDGGYQSHNLRGQLSFNKVSPKYGAIYAIAGAEFRENAAASSDDRVYGFSKETISYTYIDYVNAYPVIIGNSFGVVPNTQMILSYNDRNISLFGNAAYTYKDKYTVSASARKDGSNQFGVATNNKWSPLWSTGFSWHISKEGFYNIQALPYLRFRASFGYQGNVNKNIAAILSTTGIGNNKWRQNSSSIQNFPNENLRWEKTGITNFAVDFATENNWLSGSLEYYYKKGNDLIGLDILPPSSGQTAYTSNAANMKGNGWDLTLQTININRKLQWTSTILMSYSVDKITNYKSRATTINSFVLGTGSFNPRQGSPVNALFAFEFAGLDPNTGDPQGILKGNISKDYNLLINSTDFNDMKYQGRMTAPYFGSLMNTFSFAGIQFSFNIVYKFGHVFRRQSIYYTNALNYGNGHSDYSKRWQQPGDELITTVPSFIYPANANRDLFYNYSTALTEKGDLIRLQDIRLSYDLLKGKKFRSNMIKELTLYVTGSNLGLLWAANKHNLDPDYLPVINSMYTKPARLFSFGFKTTF